MTWVLVYLGIAVAGLVMVGCFAVWLWRKAIALLTEAGVLLERADELASILGELGQPVAGDSQSPHRIVDEDDPEVEAAIGSARRAAT